MRVFSFCHLEMSRSDGIAPGQAKLVRRLSTHHQPLGFCILFYSVLIKCENTPVPDIRQG